MNPGAVVLIGLIGLSILGIPIYMALGIGTVVAMTMSGMPLVVIPQKMFVGIDSVSLLAIPFFMIAGNVMAKGITLKLIDVSNSLIGWVKGSLGMVTVLASALFGAITGSAVATVSAIGGTTIPAMKREGYSDEFACAIASAASILGPLVPPSITLIVYGAIVETSIADLFLASIIPAIITVTAFLVYTNLYAKKHNYPSHPRMKPREIALTFKNSIWALLMPVIILGGIFGGIFTPTEASAISVVYSIIVSIFIYKDMSYKDIFPIFAEAGISAATILCLVGLSKSSSYVIVTSQLPQKVLTLFTSLTSSTVVLLIFINILFLIIGMLMEANAAIVMMTPLLMPLLTAYKIDTIHFGMIMSMNLYIGLLTPPVGVCLLLGNTIGGGQFSKTLKEAIPFMLIALVVLLLITYFPPLTTWLPSL
ncbi:MAG: TRAP transporter large permease [Lachnospiraceae bacterium]|nr:TRAP transporter large permease [Lachnospiraceae bacterium]